MPEWRRRKRGTPRQIGKPFPIEGESQQQKKGLLPKIIGRFQGDHRSPREKAFYEKIKNAIRPKEDKMLLDKEAEIFSPEDMQFLQDKGLIEIDDYSGDIELTAKGIEYIYKRRIQKRPEELEKDGSIRLTSKEREWMHRKLEEEA
jgi:hypothetical protein